MSRAQDLPERRSGRQPEPGIPSRQGGERSTVYGFSPNSLRYFEHCLGCPDTLPGPYVPNELATAERTRSLPWSQGEEDAVRIAYLGGRIASGEYPRMAAAFAEDAGPIDLEAVFERALGRVLDGFEPRG